MSRIYYKHRWTFRHGKLRYSRPHFLLPLLWIEKQTGHNGRQWRLEGQWWDWYFWLGFGTKGTLEKYAGDPRYEGYDDVPRNWFGRPKRRQADDDF